MTDQRIALVTFGEAMLRLTPPAFHRLEQAETLDVHVGGSELNVAVAAARLGLPSRWISRLPENALGRMVAVRARAQGVDISHLQWARGDRLGLSFSEVGAAPRPSSVLYDLSGSAMSQMEPGSIDWRKAFRGARWFHVSGMTPAASESAAAVIAEALAAAKAAGLTVSYDLSYRSTLWTPEQARKVQVPLMEHVDILISNDEDARLVFGTKPGRKGEAAADLGSHRESARMLQERFGLKAVAMTVRENPKVWLNSWRALVWADDELYEGPRYEVEVVDRAGAGDAFSAGFIFGALALRGWDSALRYGTALSALKHTVPGDFSLATREDVEQLLRGGNLRMNR